MAKTTKLTGFARILIFLLILLPALFFGVSYVKGENPMDTLRALFGMEKQMDSTSDTASFPNTNSDDVKELKEALKKAETQNKALKAELKDVKKQLEQIKAVMN